VISLQKYTRDWANKHRLTTAVENRSKKRFIVNIGEKENTLI